MPVTSVAFHNHSAAHCALHQTPAAMHPVVTLARPQQELNNYRGFQCLSSANLPCLLYAGNLASRGLDFLAADRADLQHTRLHGSSSCSNTKWGCTGSGGMPITLNSSSDWLAFTAFCMAMCSVNTLFGAAATAQCSRGGRSGCTAATPPPGPAGTLRGTPRTCRRMDIVV